MTIYMGADHGGFALKEHLKAWLTDRGETVVDCGAPTLDPDDDYPLYASAVAEEVSQDPTARGVLLCRSGQGVVVVANKFPSVRAGLAWQPDVARAGRADDDLNVLALPTDYLEPGAAEAIVAAWLDTSAKNDPKYHRRLKEITRIEERTMKS